MIRIMHVLCTGNSSVPKDNVPLMMFDMGNTCILLLLVVVVVVLVFTLAAPYYFTSLATFVLPGFSRCALIL